MIPYNCPRCGVENEDNTHFCKDCSYNFEFEFLENPVCPGCHTAYPIGSHFCDYDGLKLVEQSELVPECSHCGKRYPADIKYCPEDGTPLAGTMSHHPDNFQMPNVHTGNYSKANLGNRFFASLIDGLISLALSIPTIICFVFAFIQFDDYKREFGAFLLLMAALFYLMPLAYNLIKDGLGKGQSYGKKAVEIMVIDLDRNSPCKFGKSCSRNIIMMLVNIIPFVGWLIEPIMVIATEDGRRLGDRVANTQVIDVQNK